MQVKELMQKIEEFRKEHPEINEMEIAPVFWSGGAVLMMVNDITIEKNAGWDGKDAVGIHWHC